MQTSDKCMLCLWYSVCVSDMAYIASSSHTNETKSAEGTENCSFKLPFSVVIYSESSGFWNCIVANYSFSCIYCTSPEAVISVFVTVPLLSHSQNLINTNE